MAKKNTKESTDFSDAYDVGYGKPPAHTQFKKGQSGNPRGRPKGTANLATTLKRTLNEKVTIIENGRQKAVSKGEAAIKQLVNRAAQGEISFMRLLLPAMHAAEATLAAETGKATVDLTDPSILAPLVEQFERGSHVVLAPSSTNESRPADAQDDAAPGTPGDPNPTEPQS